MSSKKGESEVDRILYDFAHKEETVEKTIEEGDRELTALFKSVRFPEDFEEIQVRPDEGLAFDVPTREEILKTRNGKWRIVCRRCGQLWRGDLTTDAAGLPTVWELHPRRYNFTYERFHESRKGGSHEAYLKLELLMKKALRDKLESEARKWIEKRHSLNALARRGLKDVDLEALERDHDGDDEED